MSAYTTKYISRSQAVILLITAISEASDEELEQLLNEIGHKTLNNYVVQNIRENL